MRKAWTRVSAVVVLPTISCAAQAQTTVEFKSIAIVVGSSAGGGYDTYARVLARHIGRHIPGQPSVTVQNMPGASSLKAVQYLDANAPKDGSVMAAFNPGLITESLLNVDKIRFKFSDVAWVGSVTRDLRACYAWAATGIKTWDDLKTYKRFNMGAPAPGTSSSRGGAQEHVRNRGPSGHGICGERRAAARDRARRIGRRLRRLEQRSAGMDQQ